MSFYLKINSQYDNFYFNSLTENTISISIPVSCPDLINFIQASLHTNKFVIISLDKKSADEIKLDLLKSNHYKIENNSFIFLNFTVKKQIEKIIEQNISFSTYQEVESFLTVKLSDIF